MRASGGLRVAFLVVSLMACRQRELFDGHDELEIGIEAPATDEAIDALAQALPHVGFSAHDGRVIAVFAAADTAGIHRALRELTNSSQWSGHTYTLTLRPNDETFVVRDGAIAGDHGRVDAWLEAQPGLPDLPEPRMVPPRVVGRAPELVAALAGDALVWRGGDVLPDGTIRALDGRRESGVPIGLSGGELREEPMVVEQPPSGRHRRELIARVAGGSLYLEWWREGRVRTISALVWASADGTLRSTGRLREVMSIAVSPSHEHLAVTAHQEGRIVLLHIAVPSLAVSELASCGPYEGFFATDIDDAGVVTTAGTYGGLTGTLRFDGQAAALAPASDGGQVIAVAGGIESIVKAELDSRTHRGTLRLSEYDLATRQERVVYEGPTAGWPRVVRAGPDWYLLGQDLAMVDAAGTLHEHLAAPFAPLRDPATGRDGRIVLPTRIGFESRLQIFQHGQPIATLPAAITGPVEFRTVVH